MKRLVSGIQYDNAAIDFIQTEEGVVRSSGGSYSYKYNLADHFGNVRYTFDAAFGTTYANPQFGRGGLPQIFIPDYRNLKPVKTIPLK